MVHYSANQLAGFSAIMARCAAMRNWAPGATTGAKGSTITEVQCMVFCQKLYIAGNDDEHLAVVEYLSAFGVCDDDSFRRCLKYSHWLLTMPHDGRVALDISSFNVGYSDQELLTIGIAGNMLAPLSDKQIEAAHRLIAGTPNATDNRQLGWFLRHFVGKAQPPAALPPYTRAAAGGLGLPTTAVGAKEINVLAVGGDTHAELKLLNFIYHCAAVAPGQYERKLVRIGGLKKTCKFCAGWARHFSGMVQTHLAMAVEFPEMDDRMLGQGNGKRPITNKRRLNDLVPQPYFDAMFNGEQNNLCLDLDALHG